jgi:hypothetical protein
MARAMPHRMMEVSQSWPAHMMPACQPSQLDGQDAGTREGTLEQFGSYSPPLTQPCVAQPRSRSPAKASGLGWAHRTETEASIIRVILSGTVAC